MTRSLNQLGSIEKNTVVVVGLGPVGSVAALELAMRGITVIALESSVDQYENPQESRASTFHPPTLEMLDDLGVADDLHKTGLIAGTYQFRDRTKGVIAHFDLKDLAADTRYPYRLQSEQSNLVAIIRKRLEELPNVQMFGGATLQSLAQEGDFVTLGIEQAGTVTSISADWVIAADGSNSVVRRELDIDFEGMTYPEQFLVASTTTDLAELFPDIAYVNYISDPEEWLVLLRTPRHWRVLIPVAPSEDLDSVLDHVSVAKRLQSVAAYPPGYAVTHTTIYNVHQRVATTFRQDRVLLVGDAAHINNPLGGMGMNSGIHDAVSAAGAIAAAMQGDAHAIDEFASDRKRVALDYVQQATHRNWQVMQERDPALRAAHHADLHETSLDPERARAYLLSSSMLSSVQTSTSLRRSR